MQGQVTKLRAIFAFLPTVQKLSKNPDVGFAIIMQISYTFPEGANNTSSRGYNEHLSHT